MSFRYDWLPQESWVYLVWGPVTAYNDMMVEELASRVAANPARAMAVANMESIRGEAKYSDYVHLGPAGYTEMADLWYDAVTTA